MSFNSGILSITDHKGKYMGMQDIASCYLTGVCIDISTQGSDDNPTAIVIIVYDEEDRFKNLEDINFSAVKGDYKRNAKMNFSYDKEKENGICYRIFANNGFDYDVSLETFNNPDINFSTCNFERTN